MCPDGQGHYFNNNHSIAVPQKTKLVMLVNKYWEFTLHLSKCQTDEYLAYI